MNYSTIKKTIALSLVSLMAVGAANAQTTSSATTTTPKVFGGTDQYNTWSVGVDLGLPSLLLATGGPTGGFNHWTPTIGWGISVKDQIWHSVGIQFDYNGGSIDGASTINKNAVGGPYSRDVVNGDAFSSFKTNFSQFSLSGVINVATVDFLHRKNAIQFYAKGGFGLVTYTPTATGAIGVPNPVSGGVYPQGTATFTDNLDLVIPVGTGLKFKVTDQIAINAGYTENFIDANTVTGVNTFPTRSSYSYGYGGVEYTFGPASKPNLEWVNPVALMYDELYDEALRQEVAALKTRVGNVENAVRDLKKDSDGDGVSDQFDKCPNTPAGTVVDGSGCAIKFPAPIDTSVFMRKGVLYPGMGVASASVAAFSNIQFEFDSSVLRTSSYPVLDATSTALRASGSACELDGFASSEGTAAHNMKLSRDRANSVKTYLVNSGVDAKKLKVKAYGETHPIATNDTEDGRILNRRVEFKK